MRRIIGLLVCLATGVVPVHAVEEGSAPGAANVPVRKDFRIAVPALAVLSQNADAEELSIETGLTYTAFPPFNTPADADGKRLIDSDKPVDDSTHRAGIDKAAQVVTFDLKSDYRVQAIALRFPFAQKPDSITVSVSHYKNGPWHNVGTVKREEQADVWWRFETPNEMRNDSFADSPSVGRFVKLDFAGPSTGWTINEVKIYGSTGQAVQATKRDRDRLVLAEKRQPCATIVLADRVSVETLRAAELFHGLALRMTGAQLPIVAESRFDGKSTAVLIGDSALARKNGVQVAQDPYGDERYIIRGGGPADRFLACVGNDVLYTEVRHDYTPSFQGSLFAVYDFFERQGCGWYGPDELWQVVPKVEQLAAPRLAVSEVPAFQWRRIWMGNLPPESPLRVAWRQGGTEIASWHNYNALVPPDKYKATHPEWFGEYQPDLTNPEVIAIAVETLSKEFDARPDIPLLSFPVSANDEGGFIEKPFNPAVGNVAAQQLYFANEIAKGLRARHPNRRFTLGTLGYWFSHGGPEPMLKAEPEVVTLLVNEGNHSKPVEWIESDEIIRMTGRNNTRERNALARWKQTGGLTGIYEWWIPEVSNKLWNEVPWYDGETAVANLRYWQRNGIRYLTYESSADVSGNFSLRWAQYYIGALAQWNPNIDPRQELRAACRKLFGKAADSMVDYYLLQEKAMRDTKEHVGNWALPLPHLLYTPEIEEKGEAILLKALQEQKTGSEHLRIVAATRQWLRVREINARSRSENKRVFRVIVDGVAMNWNSQIIDAATVVSLADLPPGTEIEVLERDGQNRIATAGETYDLDGGVTFRTTKKVQAP